MQEERLRQQETQQEQKQLSPLSPLEQRQKSPFPRPGFIEEAEIKAPLIFQCAKCRLIVGDSCSWVTADRDLKCVVLFAKPYNLRLGTELVWAQEGIDLGSTYKLSYCNGCNTVIGKVYYTTPRKFDYIRDYFTIQLDCVTLYQLGTYIKDATPPEMITIPSARQLQTSMDMVQDVILVLNERITTLEQRSDTKNPSQTVGTSPTSPGSDNSEISALRAET